MELNEVKMKVWQTHTSTPFEPVQWEKWILHPRCGQWQTDQFLDELWSERAHQCKG